MPEPNDPSITSKDPKKVGSDDPPDIGQGEELLTGEEGDAGSAPPVTGPGEEQLSPESEEYIKAKGFKSVEELVKSAKNSEKKITELRQEGQLKGLGIPPPVNTPVQQPAVEEPEKEIEIPDDVYQTMSDQEKAKTFLKSFAKQVEDRTTRRITKGYAQVKQSDMQQEMYNTAAEDPKKFARLRPIMAQLANQYPHANLKQLMSAAEKVEVQQKERFTEEVRKAAGLEDIDPDKLKVLASKAQTTTPISMGAGGGQVGLAGKPKTEEQKKADGLWKDILGADTLKA